MIGCENYKRQTCINSIEHEETSYVAIISGKYVIEDDYDIDTRRVFVKALLSEFMEKMRKMLKIVWRRML